LNIASPRCNSFGPHTTVHARAKDVPWHPLHGQTILVQRSVRHGREVWLCEHDERTAAIPV
jgi:hypothetical protein